MATTLEIITGINQAAANAYDGSHDERFVPDGEAKKVGLSREEGCPIIDSRVSDGFGVKIVGDMLQINYESNVSLSSVYMVGFEEECERKLQQIADFLKKEYKVITGKSLSITPQGEAQCLVQNTSRVRTFVTAHKMYKIGGMKKVTTLGEGIVDPLAVNYYKFLKEGSFLADAPKFDEGKAAEVAQNVIDKGLLDRLIKDPKIVAALKAAAKELEPELQEDKSFTDADASATMAGALGGGNLIYLALGTPGLAAITAALGGPIAGGIAAYGATYAAGIAAGLLADYIIHKRKESRNLKK